MYFDSLHLFYPDILSNIDGINQCKRKVKESLRSTPKNFDDAEKFKCKAEKLGAETEIIQELEDEIALARGLPPPNAKELPNSNKMEVFDPPADGQWYKILDGQPCAAGLELKMQMDTGENFGRRVKAS